MILLIMNFRFCQYDDVNHCKSVLKNEVACVYSSKDDDKITVYTPNFLNKAKFNSILEKLGSVVNTDYTNDHVVYKVILNQEINTSLAFLYYHFYYVME